MCFIAWVQSTGLVYRRDFVSKPDRMGDSTPTLRYRSLWIEKSTEPVESVLPYQNRFLAKHIFAVQIRCRFGAIFQSSAAAPYSTVQWHFLTIFSKPCQINGRCSVPPVPLVSIYRTIYRGNNMGKLNTPSQLDNVLEFATVQCYNGNALSWQYQTNGTSLDVGTLDQSREMINH